MLVFSGHVVPDVIDTVPPQVLDVSYGKATVNLGNVLTPTQVKNIPSVKWEADPNKFYTLCMTGNYCLVASEL